MTPDRTNRGSTPAIAALFVQTKGCYFGLEGVDPWDSKRDARLYPGPHSVVAHPPCARWSRLADGAFGRKATKKRGDDDGCFASALASVRRWGGVLEHPEASSAWRTFGLTEPTRGGGWIAAGDFVGWTCCVEQGHFGHTTRKSTWLYVVGPGELPTLPWGSSTPPGYVGRRERGDAFCKMSQRQRSATPAPFRDLLISIARDCSRRAAA